ncbi:MAG TPA: DUF4276 family protein [Vicinamibacteria bacterium]|nr:DUF4276 family protein [Vicinamibacteria bacterium]
MQRTLRVAPIVEGHGEVAAVRTLIQRIWTEVVQGDYVDVLSPIRQPKSKLIREQGLERAVRLATAKLTQQQTERVQSLILVLVDADEDCPAELGSRLIERARSSTHVNAEVCIAQPEYETWFAGAATSLEEFLDLGNAPVPEDPEAQRAGKAWIKDRFRGAKYSETVDQVRLTARMDLLDCQRRCPSFSRMCAKLKAIAASE